MDVGAVLAPEESLMALKSTLAARPPEPAWSGERLEDASAGRRWGRLEGDDVGRVDA